MPPQHFSPRAVAGQEKTIQPVALIGHFKHRHKTLRAAATTAFSLIELLAAISVVAILTLIGFSTVKTLRYKSNQVQCVSNLRALAMGFQLFEQDNNGYLPGSGINGSTRWLFLVGAYMNLGPTIEIDVEGHKIQVLENAYKYSVFHSPFTDPQDYNTGTGPRNSVGIYGSNDMLTLSGGTIGYPVNSIARPEQTILLAEHSGGYPGQDEQAAFVRLNRSGPYPQYYNGIASNTDIHRSGGLSPTSPAKGPASVLFADMHVAIINLEDMTPWPGGPNGRITFNPN